MSIVQSLADRLNNQAAEICRKLIRLNTAVVGPSNRRVLTVLAGDAKTDSVGWLSGNKAWGWLCTRWLRLCQRHGYRVFRNLRDFVDGGAQFPVQAVI